MIILTANCVRHCGQEDHQTGVLTLELIDGYGLPSQQMHNDINYHNQLTLQS
ncbi:hypothetical protein [Nostoc sp.]|uniref:hypothetical protein n=1 Tax=Nostoc sp. TaxID=1180 RepID=UPI002FF51180